MGIELGNFRLKALPGARGMGAMAMIALLAPAAAFAQGQMAMQARIGIVVDAPSRSLQPGGAAQFLVRVENSGTGQPGGSRLQIPLADGLSGQAWTCTAHAGASCASPSGSGTVNQALTGLSAGGWIEYTLVANVSSTPPAFVELQASTTSAASARCAGDQTQPCRTFLSLPTGVSLYLDVSSASGALQPGGQVSYTITSHSHNDQSSTSGSVLRSPVPNGLINSSWTCSSSVGACLESSGSGPIEQQLGDFSGGDISFQVNATVASSPPATIVQAAAITPPNGGSCARIQSNVPTFTPAPCSARKSLATSAKILVSRTQDYSSAADKISNRFVLENIGTNANGSVITAALPQGALGLTWSCSASGATCPRASGSGAIQQTVGSWPTAGKLIYDLVVQRDPAGSPVAPGSLTVVPPAMATCGQAGTSPPCQAVDAKPATAVFELSQQAGRVGALPGRDLQYSITVANRTSDTAAQDVVLSVPLAKGLQSIMSWTCSSADPAIACPVASGNGPINQLYPDFAPGSRFTYAIQARVASLPPATIDARATLVAPAPASMGCASGSGSAIPCESSTQFSTVPILALEQSATATSATPGGLVNYVLDVFNLGADAGVVNVENVLPESIASASWVCSGLGMGCPKNSGSGNISESIVQMPEGSSVRYNVSAQVNGTLPESVSNVLVAAPAAGGRCHSDATESLSAVPCSDRFVTSFSPNLELSQTSAERQLLRGGVVNYSVTLKNSGGAAADAQFGMGLPEGISHLDWTCSGFKGAVCSRTAGSGAINEAVAALPASAHLTYSIRAVLAQDAPDAIADLVAATPAAGTQCMDGECNSTLSLPVTEVPSAHLQVSVKSPTSVVRAGDLALWMVDVRNLGSEIAGAFSVRNAFENSGFEPQSWTCLGDECPAASGVGPLSSTIKSLAVYQGDGSERKPGAGRVVFTVLGMIRRQPTETAMLSAVVTPAAGDTCGPVGCQANLEMPVDVLGGSLLTVELISMNTQVVYPDSFVYYDFYITNTGGATINNVTATSDALPPALTSISWDCFLNGSPCPVASGTGPINEVFASLPVSSQIYFEIIATTASSVPPIVDYTVGANANPAVPCVPASCTSTLTLPGADELTITLDANLATVYPGAMVDYTFRIENTGGGPIFGFDAETIEPNDFAASSWTCVPLNGANCASSGVGPILQSISSMPPGSSVTFTISALMGPTLAPTVDFEAGAGFLGGQAQTPLGMLPCNPVSCYVLLSLPSGPAPLPEITLTKTANQTSLDPGGSVRYDVVVANNGNVDASNFQLSDVIPAGLDSFTWSCSATGQAGCSSSTGTGDIDEYVEYLPVGASITYVVDAVVSANASGTVTNLASLIPFEPMICAPFSCSVDSVLPVGQPAALSVSKVANPASGTPVAANQAINWTLRASNSGGATRDNLVLTDRIPANVVNASAVAGSGVTCNTLNPQPGANLVCTIAAGFTGDRTVNISATVSSGATGSVTNTVNATGSDGPACSPCTVSNPIAAGIDASIANARAYVAGGMAGTLFDIVNMSASTAQAASVVVTPASAVRFLAPYSSGCTATPGTGDSIVVSCPSPPDSQGINCSANICTVGSLPQNSAVTLFVARNAGATATVQLIVPGDSDPSDNFLELPPGGTP